MAHMKQMCISMSLGFRNNGSHRGQKIGMYKQFHHRFSLNFVSQSKTHLDVLLYFNTTNFTFQGPYKSATFFLILEALSITFSF